MPDTQARMHARTHVHTHVFMPWISNLECDFNEFDQKFVDVLFSSLVLSLSGLVTLQINFLECGGFEHIGFDWYTTRADNYLVYMYTKWLRLMKI